LSHQVDFSGTVGDDFLEQLGLVKGIRKVVNHEERGKVLRALDGRSYKLSAGGSLSNTLVALARLGTASTQSRTLNVAMTGSVGSDALGDFYRTKLLRAGVHFLSQPVVDGTTGTVIVLTTPDAQRTMLSYQVRLSRYFFR
jgi:sugar/nucleoside kinase (ribokinase family)